MRLLAKGRSQVPLVPPWAASLWFEYVRLLGTPTVISIAMATCLHGCYCELSSQSIHWGTAILVVVVSLCMSVAFWRRPATLGWAAACAVLAAAWLLNYHSSDVCEVHQGFLVTLALISLGTTIASAQSSQRPEFLSMSGQESLLSEPDPDSTPALPTCAPDEAIIPPASAGGEEQPGDNQQRFRGKWLVAGLLLAAFLIYMIVVPVVAMLWEMWNPRPAMRRELTEMSLDEYFRLHTVSGVIMAMFLAMGASVGSFLNVVIFRLPRGRALLWPPSACAACGTRITGRDNIPILAWLNLSGKCRLCQVAISARYPLVEAIVAALFVIFFYRELLSGGVNLPVRTSNVYNGIVWILFYTKWDLVTLYVFHMFVLTCLLGWAMMNFDRFRVPTRTLAFTLLTVFVLVTLAPHLNPLLAHGPSAGSQLAAASHSLIGLVAGGLIGIGLTRVFPLDLPQPSAASDPFQALPDMASQTAHSSANNPTNQPTDQVQILQTEAVGDSAAQAAALTNHGSTNTIAGPMAEEASDVSAPVHDLYGNRAAAPSRFTDAAGALALIGATFGIQAAIGIALGTCLLATAVRLARLLNWPAVGQRPAPALPITLIMFVVAAVYLAFWNSLHVNIQSISWQPVLSSAT